MCDQDHYEDDLAKYLRPELSRRQFGAVSLGIGMAMLLPRSADALDVAEAEVNIKTPDGTADCYFVHPSAGAHAGVVVWPDILGLRPAFRQMGKRLAEAGYSVLVVNPFYRGKKAPVVPEGASFANEAVRNSVMPLAQALNATTHTADAKAFVAWLDTQPSVSKTRKIGTTGYCMGGPIVMRTAAAVPDRVGAGASFHGGGLVTQAADSPHLLVPQMKAQFLRGRRERRHARSRGEERPARHVREGEAAGGDRSLRGRRARLVPARFAGLQPGAGRESVEPPAGAVRKSARLAEVGWVW